MCKYVYINIYFICVNMYIYKYIFYMCKYVYINIYSICVNMYIFTGFITQKPWNGTFWSVQSPSPFLQMEKLGLERLSKAA